ncbi:uncharacterized protein LOC128259963 isoform X2 [Drosophila gunungcola]|uniref:uncharacterized protein LOC128259900 isoform X2 n=1 Tax=Drosophila gunungcola TaxID=103775 RepID=UPI0022E471A8|nr:uncharacterized protein LOC128259900 isoform X2 [Drosophila gunungcola]XP_052848576.1 uncharacterized protein LOC128259963 isoform X2 [Drosophila gunungcola]
MGFTVHFNVLFVLLLMDLGQPNSEHEDYIDPEEPPDDHLTRPDMEYVDGDNEVKTSFDYHNENQDHLTIDQPDPQNETLADINIETYDDHLTTEFEDLYDRILDVLSPKMPNEDQEDQNLNQDLSYHNDPDPDDEYEIEDRIVRYAMHQWHEEI